MEWCSVGRRSTVLRSTSERSRCSIPMARGGLPPRLFAGFEAVGFATVKGIAQWDGVSWSALGTGVNPTGSIVESLIVHDDGTGPSLFVGGWFDYAGGMSGRRRCTMVGDERGSPWVRGSVGTVEKSTISLACDGPGGPAIYACGEFGSWPNAHVARWNGSAWQSLGTGLEISGSGRAIIGFDDGTGPAVDRRRALPDGQEATAVSLPGPMGLPSANRDGAQSGGAGTPAVHDQHESDSGARVLQHLQRRSVRARSGKRALPRPLRERSFVPRSGSSRFRSGRRRSTSGFVVDGSVRSVCRTAVGRRRRLLRLDGQIAGTPLRSEPSRDSVMRPPRDERVLWRFSL